jgi:hypothetical protein
LPKNFLIIELEFQEASENKLSGALMVRPLQFGRIAAGQLYNGHHVSSGPAAANRKPAAIERFEA